MNRPTIEQIKAAMKDEGQRHMLDQQSFLVNIPPVIVSPHQNGFNHGAKCICGHGFNIVTQHDAKSLAGQMELTSALTADYAEHVRTAMAVMIHQLYEPTQ